MDLRNERLVRAVATIVLSLLLAAPATPALAYSDDEPEARVEDVFFEEEQSAPGGEGTVEFPSVPAEQIGGGAGGVLPLTGATLWAAVLGFALLVLGALLVRRARRTQHDQP